jgi:diguanylate cyclase (GGDEF)-like protein
MMAGRRAPALLRPLAAALALLGAVAAALAAVPAPAAAAVQAAHPAAALIERAGLSARDDPESSRRDAEQALGLLARAPDPDLEIRARLLLCDYQSERDALAARAEIAAGRARLPFAKRQGLAAGLTTCEGEVRETAGDNAGAAAAFEEAVRIASDAHDDEMLAGALFARGYLLGVQGEYAHGLADLKRTQQLYERLGMPIHALTALNSIAILYNRLGDDAEALHIYARALEAQRAANMRREQGVTLHNIGRAHERLHEWPAARRAFEEALAIHTAIDYRRGMAYSLRGLAAVANAERDPRRALELLDRAAGLEREASDARLRAQIALARGESLHLAGRNADALAALATAHDVFAAGNALTELADTERLLSDVRAALGDWRGAYQAQVQAAEIAERLLRNQLDQRFATLKVEFDTAAKEKENALLLRENAASLRALAQQEKARRLTWLVLALVGVLAALLATLAVRQWLGSDRMRRLAMTDELTGVPNRRAVLGRLDEVLRRRDGGGCAVLLLDVDNFKTINDQHGHPAGDEVLRLIADGLRALVVEPAFLGRLGGEEFLFVLPGASLEQGRQFAERLRAAVMALDASRWVAGPITASLGIAVQQTPDDTTSTVLQRADAALYEAKRGGRNRVVAGPAVDPAGRAA